MKKYFFLIILFLISNLFTNIKAQEVNIDPNYEIDYAHSDSFNYVKKSLWGTNLIPNNTWGDEDYSSTNVDISNGELTLTCKKRQSPSSGQAKFSSGGICTCGNFNYGYGYIEIETKFPDYGIRGPWGGFWLHTAQVDPGSSCSGWDEIDVCEPNGCQIEMSNVANNINGLFNSGIKATNSCTFYETNTPSYPNSGESPSLNYIKVGVKYSPKDVKLYFNGELYRHFDGRNYFNMIPKFPLTLFLTFQVEKPPVGCAWQSSQVWPVNGLKWKFRNLKYYKLKMDCSTPVWYNNFPFSSFDYKVKKNYSINNSILNQTSPIFLKAVDYVELSYNVLISVGSTLDITTYNNFCN